MQVALSDETPFSHRMPVNLCIANGTTCTGFVRMRLCESSHLGPCETECWYASRDQRRGTNHGNLLTSLHQYLELGPNLVGSATPVAIMSAVLQAPQPSLLSQYTQVLHCGSTSLRAHHSDDATTQRCLEMICCQVHSPSLGRASNGLHDMGKNGRDQQGLCALPKERERRTLPRTCGCKWHSIFPGSDTVRLAASELSQLFTLSRVSPPCMHKSRLCPTRLTANESVHRDLPGYQDIQPHRICHVLGVARGWDPT